MIWQLYLKEIRSEVSNDCWFWSIQYDLKYQWMIKVFGRLIKITIESFQVCGIEQQLLRLHFIGLSNKPHFPFIWVIGRGIIFCESAQTSTQLIHKKCVLSKKTIDLLRLKIVIQVFNWSIRFMGFVCEYSRSALQWWHFSMNLHFIDRHT